MKEQELLYWASFSHRWSLHLLGGFFLLLVLTIVVSKSARREGASDRLVVAAKVCKVVLGVAAVPLLVGQMHIPCSNLVRLRSSCLRTVKSLSLALTTYATDNDDLFPVRDDWVTVADTATAPTKCEGATGTVSYAINAALRGLPTSKVDDPGTMPLIFDANQRFVCGQECLATDRHQGSPSVGFVDGRATSANEYRRAEIAWSGVLSK